MDALELFAELTRDLCAVVLQGQQMTLEERVVSVNASLARVLAAGVALPILPGELDPDPPSPFDGAGWPGFGSYESYWTVGALAEPGSPIPCQLSQTLRFVFAQLFDGLERYEAGDREGAAGSWGLGYEQGWGLAGTELLHVLQPIVAGYRADARARVRRRRRVSTELQMVRPQREEAPRPGDRPMLGVRFEPCAGGVRVLDVHPGGPAAGLLVRGDIVLAVQGEPLAGLDADQAGAQMVGPIGELRRYEVFREGATQIVQVATVGALG